MIYSELGFVDNEALQRIHESSLAILERTGMVIDHPAALNLLRDAGCRVDFDASRVRFPPDLVTAQLERFPRSFLLAGRDPIHDLIVGTGSKGFVTRPVIGPERILDHRTDEVRTSTLGDLREWATVVDALDNIDFLGILSPGDVPLMSRDITAAGMALRFCTKHMHSQVSSGQAIDYLARMSEVIAGSSAQARARPPISSYSVCISPLHLAKTGVERILAAGRHGIPVGLNSTPIMGATGPITIAGIVALLNAEILGQNTILQLAHPGSAVIYAARPLAMDMKTMVASYNMIEAVMAVGLTVELAKRKYGFVVDVVGPSTDSKMLDFQSGLERAWTSLIPILAGADIIIAASAIDSCATGSLEHLAMDDDMFLSLKRLHQGVAVGWRNLRFMRLMPLGRGAGIWIPTSR